MRAFNPETSHPWRNPYTRGEYEAPPVRPSGRTCQCGHPKVQSEFEQEVGSTTMLPTLASSTHDFTLRGLADGSHGRVPKEFLEAILVRAQSDATNLTYRVFWHVNHPELSGKMLDPKEPKQSALRFEWSKVLRTQVGPLIWFRQIVDQIDRHRGTIPREFLLGWMAVESDGQVGVTTGRGERGYFQVDWLGGEAREQLGLTKAQFDRLSTDRAFSIAKGVELVQKYRAHILTKYPSVPDGSDLLLRLTKCRHAASGIIEAALTGLVKSGTPLTSAAVSAKVPGWLVKNVDAAMDYAAKLRTLANLVPAPAVAQPELEEWEYQGETPTTTETPVLDLAQFKQGAFTGAFIRKAAGFESLFCGELPSPQASFTISGKLMIEAMGVRRAVTAAELKKLAPKSVVNRVYTGRGVSASTNPLSRVGPDGTFVTESMVVVDPGTRRIRVQVTLELSGGRDITAEAVFQYNALDCFLAFIDSYESRRPIGQVTGSCHIAFGHLEFLSSVRKMFQPAPGSSLAGMFDQFLHRHRKICQLADVNSAQGKYIRSFETITIGSDKVDLGHVLVGIEAQRRQKPESVLPFVRADVTTEALMTWAGDLGSALEPYAEAVVAGRSVDLKTYLDDKAGFADLLGDIDGINIGNIYDETKPLSENLRKYYGAPVFRRYHDYLARLTDDSGKPLITLAQQSPPRIDKASRNRLAGFIGMFANGVALKRGVMDKMTQPQQVRFSSMLQLGSKEITQVVDYFCAFIEAGLAKEP